MEREGKESGGGGVLVCEVFGGGEEGEGGDCCVGSCGGVDD